jgi:hypothetical protein
MNLMHLRFGIAGFVFGKAAKGRRKAEGSRYQILGGPEKY